MATVELIKTINTYNIGAVSWAPIVLITDLGVAQLRIYFKTVGNTVWTELTKSSWQSTYNTGAQTVDLKNATYTQNNVEYPAYIDSSLHELKLVRSTSSSLYVTFSDGSKLSGRDLNIANLQAIHYMEEQTARLDAADTTIYSYIATTLNNYYTKTEVDGFFDANTTIPAWLNGETYTEGAVVLHDDPFTESNEVLIWYATSDHIANTGIQPSVNGPGSAYWSRTQNTNVLDNLNYIRKAPGLGGTGEKWNSIVASDKDAHGLVLYPHNPQSVDLFAIYDLNKSPALRFTPSNQFVLNTNATMWTKGNAYLAGSNWLNFVPTDTTSNSPVLSLKGRGSENAFEVVKSTATSNTNNILFTIDDSSVFTGAASHYIDGGTVEFINKLVWFSGTETQDCYGFSILDGNGEPPFTEVRFGRDAKFGTLASCVSTFAPTIHIEASTGNVTTDGTVEAHTLKTTNVPSADYLKTDANGQVIAGSGNPTTNRLVLEITGSNTNLSDRDVVYLNNATSLWTKARANDLTTLAVAMIDNVTGTSGNQSFDVVFSGAVGGFTNLEVGNWYWLDTNTAGAITSTVPSGSGALIDPVGVAVNATTLFVVPARPHKLPTT